MSNGRITELLTNGLIKVVKDELNGKKSKEEIKVFMNKIKSLDYSDIISNSLFKIAEGTLSDMKNQMYEAVMSFRSVELEFLARQEQKWYKAFVASEAMYIMVMESSESYANHVKGLSDKIIDEKIYTYTAMLHIHGRAMQQYLEIITLMKNGFADGAYSRWRSMYELTVISSFITKYGESVAKAFIEACDTDDSYEWTKVSKAFGNKKYISFNDIQKICGLNTKDWKESYILANKTIHASSQGTFDRLGSMGTTNCIPAGRSDYGMIAPGENSAISLSQITIMFYNIFLYEDGFIYMKCINDWVEVIREIYFKTHDEIFLDEKSI